MTADEDWARRQLRPLGDTELPIGGSATADRVLARHRTRRRARAAWLGVAAAVVLAVSIPVALAGTRPAPRPSGGAVAATASHSPATPEFSARPPAGPSADPGPMATRSGPVSAKVGVAYPFDLYTHCGIRVARFAGREWTAIHPAADPERMADSTGITHYTGYVSGTMRLVAPDLLRFTLTDPYAAGTGRSFDFVPARSPQPLCG